MRTPRGYRSVAVYTATKPQGGTLVSDGSEENILYHDDQGGRTHYTIACFLDTICEQLSDILRSLQSSKSAFLKLSWVPMSSAKPNLVLEKQQFSS